MDSADDLDDFEKPCPRRDRKRRNRRLRLLGGAKPKKMKKKAKWWVLKDSEVKRADRFEGKPIGRGVFATRRVKKKIYFTGGEYMCLTKIHRDCIRRDYAVCSYDINYVVTPTVVDIQTGNLRYCWMINHSTKDPTHIVDWDNTESQSYPYGRGVLIPLRTVEKGGELTFDYNNK